jgi:hypothetical protein
MGSAAMTGYRKNADPPTVDESDAPPEETEP